MDFTINCTRVPIPQGTTLYGIPVDVGLAPASTGSVSNLGAFSGDSYDGITSNPTGRVVPDREESVPIHPMPKIPLSKCVINYKETTIISSLNTRTLVPLGRLKELANNTMLQNIDIVAVQEHRFHHPDRRIKYHQVESFNLVTSSATKNSANASVVGVGFLLSAKATNNLLSVESISPRILVIELVGNPKITVICVYSPHNGSSLDEIDEFYMTLRQTVQQVPLHNFLVIAGDLNAKLGPEEVPFTYNSITNRNGELLKDFMDEFSLFSANNNFMNQVDNSGLLNIQMVNELNWTI